MSPHKKPHLNTGSPRLQVSVGSYNSVMAAVHNGADEILFCVNTMMNLAMAIETVRYCRLRGIKTIYDFSAPQSDKMLPNSAELIQTLRNAGLDAVLVSDLGLIRTIKMQTPAIKLHLATVYSVDGLNQAMGLGCVRASLSSKLTKFQIQELVKNKGTLELDMLIIGPACPATPSIPCLLGAKSGRPDETCFTKSTEGSATKPSRIRLDPSETGDAHGDGMQCPCRKSHGYGGKADSFPLSMQDICLIPNIEEVLPLNVDVLRIVPVTERPEVTVLFTQLAAKSIEAVMSGAANAAATPKDLMPLWSVLGRSGFTDGFFTGITEKITEHIITPIKSSKMLEQLRTTYLATPDLQRVCVRFFFQLAKGTPAHLAVDDYEGHTIYVTGPEPTYNPQAFITEAELSTKLFNTHGTIYYCDDARSRIENGFSISVAALNEMKSQLISKLNVARQTVPPEEQGQFRAGVRFLPRREPPVITVQLTSIKQLSSELLKLKPAKLYIPLSELASNPEKMDIIHVADVTAVAVLPRIITDAERGEVIQQLQRVYSFNIKESMVYNSAHKALAAEQGFTVRADTWATNSQTLKELKHSGFLSASISPVMPINLIREMSHTLDTELMLYGRIPLLLSESCLVKQAGGFCNCESRCELTDEHGQHHPIIRDTGHRSLLLDSEKIWMVDYEHRWDKIGLWAAKLYFTTENARECFQVTESYLGLGKYAPNHHKTGFYLAE